VVRLCVKYVSITVWSACVCLVCAVAEKVIWECLVEEPTLFLRVFLERLTHRDKQDELIFLLRKVLYFVDSLPAQTAHSLFNYIVSSHVHHRYFRFSNTLSLFLADRYVESWARRVCLSSYVTHLLWLNNTSYGVGDDAVG